MSPSIGSRPRYKFLSTANNTRQFTFRPFTFPELDSTLPHIKLFGCVQLFLDLPLMLLPCVSLTRFLKCMTLDQASYVRCTILILDDLWMTRKSMKQDHPSPIPPPTIGCPAPGDRRCRASRKPQSLVDVCAKVAAQGLPHSCGG